MFGDIQVAEVWASMPSKNLINPADIQDGKYIDQYGYLRDDADAHYVWVPIQGNENYIYMNSRLNGTSYKTSFALYNSKKNYISGTRTADERATTYSKSGYISPKNYTDAKWCCVSWTQNLEWITLCPEVANSSGEYIPYGNTAKKLWTFTPKHTEISDLYLDATTGGIELPYVPTLNTKVYCYFAQDWAYDDPSYNREEDQALVFHAGPQFAAAYTTYNSYNSYGGKVRCSVGKNSYTGSDFANGGQIKKGKWGSVTLDGKLGKANCNNSSDYTIAKGDVAPTQNLVFFGKKPTDSSGMVDAKGKFYEAKVYEDDVLIYDLRAVKKDADGVKCVYDKISRKYFYAQLSNPT